MLALRRSPLMVIRLILAAARVPPTSRSTQRLTISPRTVPAQEGSMEPTRNVLMLPATFHVPWVSAPAMVALLIEKPFCPGELTWRLAPKFPSEVRVSIEVTRTWSWAPPPLFQLLTERAWSGMLVANELSRTFPMLSVMWEAKP